MAKKKLTKTQQLEETCKSLRLANSQLDNEQDSLKEQLKTTTKHLKGAIERTQNLEKALDAMIVENKNRIRREDEADKFNRRYFKNLREALLLGNFNELTSLTEIAKYQGRMAQAREGLQFFGQPLVLSGSDHFVEGSGSHLNRAQAVLDGSHWEEPDPFRNHHQF